jgi:hypothetical protein
MGMELRAWRWRILQSVFKQAHIGLTRQLLPPIRTHRAFSFCVCECNVDVRLQSAPFLTGCIEAIPPILVHLDSIRIPPLPRWLPICVRLLAVAKLRCPNGARCALRLQQTNASISSAIIVISMILYDFCMDSSIQCCGICCVSGSL